MAVTSTRPPEPSPVLKPLTERQRRNSEYSPRDRVVRLVLGLFALLPMLALAFLAYELIRQAYPSFVFYGTQFFTGKGIAPDNQYSTVAPVIRHGFSAPHGAHYGVAPLIFGTLVSSLIALVFAVPISVAGAILLVERIPRRLQDTLGVFLELLAGIPSVIFGLWGVFAFGPFLSRYVYRYLADLGIPGMRGGVTSNGSGLLTSSLVLAVMIIPIVAATTRELIRSVPQLTKEGAVALGLTASESVRLVTLPFIRTGVIAAAFLGWGRALGETIAVLLISGNATSDYPSSIFAPFATMASTIAALLDQALNDSTKMGVHALAELGLVLLAVTLITNFTGRLIARRFSGGPLPVGRGV
ncbi:MAG: phosphate ABC transporter permease subunit PstC [Acidimicrobiales bacterium]